MLIELFLTNLASAEVVDGGMSIPESGTEETFTVNEADGVFPVVRRGIEQFHFKDRTPASGSEIIRCIETNGPHWTVIRGAEGTIPVMHGRGFTIRQVITAGFLQRLGSGSTTELVNAVTVCDADPTGEEPSNVALEIASKLGPVYLPSGVYSLEYPVNLAAGSVLLSFGQVSFRPVHKFAGECAVSLLDGPGRTRIEGVTLDGSLLGAGTDVYGIWAETRKLEAELRNIRITGFSESGMIVSGQDWVLDRVSCIRNHGSGFEFNLTDPLLVGCRSVGNARYGFTGISQGDRGLIGCRARDNKLGDWPQGPTTLR